MTDEIHDVQVACFQLGEDLYAVDIMRIKEIIRPQKLTHLPKVPAFVEGVINLRGTVIPVVDLRMRFDLPDRAVDERTRLLIVMVAKQALGLIVDDVTEVISVAVKDIKPPPLVAGGIGAEYILGVCLAGDDMIMLLNIDRILTEQETSELSRVEGLKL